MTEAQFRRDLLGSFRGTANWKFASELEPQLEPKLLRKRYVCRLCVCVCVCVCVPKNAMTRHRGNRDAFSHIGKLLFRIDKTMQFPVITG